jgi:sugar phosphate isomerase/epimerase
MVSPFQKRVVAIGPDSTPDESFLTPLIVRDFSTMARLGFGLYTLYPLEESYADQLRRAARAGYDGVDFVHKFHVDMDVDAVERALSETGLEASAVQVGRSDLRSGIEDLVDRYGRLGVSTMVYHSGDENWNEYRARDIVELIRRRAVELRDHDWDLLIHPNHWDYVPPIQRPVVRSVPWLGLATRLERAGLFTDSDAIDRLALNESRFSRGVNIILDQYRSLAGLNADKTVDRLHETMVGRYLALDRELVGFMLDVGFPAIRGYDPVAVLEYLGDRVEQVHLEDVCVADVTPGRWPPFCQVGEGDVDFESVMRTAIDLDVRWLTFSHDPPDAEAALEVMERGMRLGDTVLDQPR